MKAVLLTRYPRVDTPAWKRRLAQALLDAGVDVGVLYSRSSLRDQVEAGLKEFGARAAAEKFLSLTGRGATAGSRQSDQAAPPAESLAAWATARRLPVAYCDRLSDDEALQRLREMAPDVLVLAGADIVPAAALELPRVATINAHYGLLPAYRGMNVTEWSIYHDDPLGVTVHIVDPGIDTGDILLREEIGAGRDETLETLRAKHQDVAQKLLLEAVLALRDGREHRVAQRAADGRQYYRMHPALRAVVERKLAAGYRPAGAAVVVDSG